MARRFERRPINVLKLAFAESRHLTTEKKVDLDATAILLHSSGSLGTSSGENCPWLEMEWNCYFLMNSGSGSTPCPALVEV
ncbi:Hypothetical predicted protein [Olea europaea subsp. europaea]|uniref:Uncharacterized protein n=1 Tax=Olea europaea subsp. europaea TaxID=158383 RepID=A0A8S0TR55_OLEEU|nr:Hypothetical predicted protein [Olea europaea subsp. europaea]